MVNLLDQSLHQLRKIGIVVITQFTHGFTDLMVRIILKIEMTRVSFVEIIVCTD